MSNLTANNPRSQLRALPVRGGKDEITYCYAVRVSGGWEEVNHSFTEWAVGDFNGQAKQEKNDDSANLH
ncbi:TPA: hypothetical protein ACJJYF_001010 [Enterobacter cloacae]|uniref:hypothetical protein n=1 Tax=Enterobacter cloacae TaxID=550 RepID=UPI0006D9AA63|nr:hypothetical protein [Enterobacter cloacae]ELV3371545.1 hypothetical protein [Enterobacter cloacae]KPU01335.1 hypothetical protein AN697_26145 [Enterobacter cloacae subsp. cloacae]KPU02856.1 hypothetical protein AN697_20940 [Enterobacter cloacae subsp. cloacae]QCC94452.1 hypothetical protein E7735_26340 [Enterobacter cloacae]QCC99638.1 hypothetical protein E7739_27115 [Enterobacter cloacae]